MRRHYYKVLNFCKRQVVRYLNSYIEKFTSRNTSEKEFSVAPLRNSFNKMKLPKSERQPFSRQSDIWSEFNDNFQCALYQNSSLSDIQKMTSLKSLLRRSALSMISSFQLSSEKYNAALKLLKERFDNKQLEIAIHMKNLLKLRQFIFKNLSQLRSVYDNIETQISS